jgi:hypothetical protein
MKVWITQAGTGTFSLGIYDSSLALVASVTGVSGGSTGLTSGTLSSGYALTAGSLYYFAVGGTINGAAMLGMTSRYTSNTPYVSKQDINATSLPSTFSGGSSTSTRIWIGAYA